MQKLFETKLTTSNIQYHRLESSKLRDKQAYSVRIPILNLSDSLEHNFEDKVPAPPDIGDRADSF
jgi:hypothetical protein